MPESKRLLIMAQVIKKKDIRGRKVTGYKATLGNVEADGKSSQESIEKLSSQVEALTRDLISPLVFWSLDRREVWIRYRDAYGWHYTIHRPQADSHKVAWHYSISSSCGSLDTAEECADRMMAHWYQNNIEPIVIGMFGLGGYRWFNCPKCQSAVAGWPIRERTYRCNNPRCNHETVE